MRKLLYGLVLIFFTFSANATDLLKNVVYQNKGWCAELSSTNCVTPKQSTKQNTQVAVTCFSQGERISGMNKICYYDCLGSEVAITISAVALCPLSIQR